MGQKERERVKDKQQAAFAGWPVQKAIPAPQFREKLVKAIAEIMNVPEDQIGEIQIQLLEGGKK